MEDFKVFAEAPELDFQYSLKMKDHSKFVLGDCAFTYYKTRMGSAITDPCDKFAIELQGNYGREEADKKIKEAVNFLIYLTGVPFEVLFYHIKSEDMEQFSDAETESPKLNKIKALNVKYNEIPDKKKEMFLSIMSLYAMATKYNILYNDTEESFFLYFRIVERIVEDEYNKSTPDQQNGSYIKRAIAKNEYGINLPQYKIDEYTSRLEKILFNQIFSDIYSKIAWFCRKKKISYDAEILGKAVQARNSLAHGKGAEIDASKEEYKFIWKLAQIGIGIKYFDTRKNNVLGINIKYDVDVSKTE